MAAYTSQYPPAQNATYVKATTTSTFDDGLAHYPYNATNPAKSLTGAYFTGLTSNVWFADAVTNQRFHIDLGSAKIVRRIYYENFHNSGNNTTYGVKTFTFWGSNNATSFAELTYGTDTAWTQLSLEGSVFAEHSGADEADPKYILVYNTTAFRYYAIKISDAYRADLVDYGMGVRRFELQTEDGFSPIRGFAIMF